MTIQNRRIFILQVATATTALAAAAGASAQQGEKVTEDDPYARSMGFKLDTNKVDKKRYPRHDAATQMCSKCQLYGGKPNDPLGPCSFFGDRLVPPNGWCRNFKPLKA